MRKKILKVDKLEDMLEREKSILNYEPDSIERATHCSANAHITKPFHSAQLAEKVTGLLSIPQRQSYRVLLKIAIKGNYTNESFFCSSRDISSTGFMIETDKQLAKGDHLFCSFFLPGFGRIVADGEIMRTDNSADTPCYGIRFQYLDPECKNGIDSFVAKRTGQ